MDKKKMLPSAAVLFIMAAIIINPAVYIQSALNGMLLFVLKVLPALFPFFFFSQILILLEADKVLGNIASRPLKKIYNAPPSGGYILIMSLMCGYPIGARLIGDFYKSRIIDAGEARGLASIASTGGPLFILGTIGAVILNNAAAAVIILISHYLSAFINGLIYKNKKGIKSVNTAIKTQTTLSDSVYNAVISILFVGGYIIVFNIICDMLLNYKIIDAVSYLIRPVAGESSEGLLLGVIEVTRGTITLAGSGLPVNKIIPFIAATVTFGGLSVIFQSITFLDSANIRTGEFMLMKITQCAISYISALILTALIL
ncbi:MAG: hypothetical protein ACOX3U_03175 [Christensenellales bacterium]|jgi:sporulation integral membrane protein YlbJ